MSQNLYVETKTSFNGFRSEVSSTLNKNKIFSVLYCQCTCTKYFIGFVISVKKDEHNKAIKENATIIVYASGNPFKQPTKGITFIKANMAMPLKWVVEGLI